MCLLSDSASSFSMLFSPSSVLGLFSYSCWPSDSWLPIRITNNYSSFKLFHFIHIKNMLTLITYVDGVP